MTILVTGVAGFIGFHVARALLTQGKRVVGLDKLEPARDVQLSQARLGLLRKEQNFSFLRRDIADEGLVDELATPELGIESIVHLAAKSAVRESLHMPFSYGRSNLHGHLVLCELARRLRELERLRHFLFASSSSVYGGNEHFPSRIDDRVDIPLSLYAASKRCNELITQAYVQLFSIPATGLRFFTVYGPWGRPDMALFQFTDAILRDREITLFNHGKMERDFVYIDDVVDGLLRALPKPPSAGKMNLYNLGSDRMESLERLVSILETALDKKAHRLYAPLQPGDPRRSRGDISASRSDLGYSPQFTIDQGVPLSVAWYRDFYNL